MRSAIVLGGRFRVFEDGRVNRIKKGLEEPANMSASCRDGKYLVISYSVNKKQKHVYVHRLVAMTFIPNPDDLPEVNHIDGDTWNNAVSNLEWVTRKENHIHAIKIGLANEKATAEPCKVCGKWTLGKDGICPKCSADIQTEANRIDRIAKQSDRYSMIDLDRCSKRQAEYVSYAMLGLTSAEIARECGVSRQVVNDALHRAEIDCKPIVSKSIQNKVVALLRKIERNKCKMEEAASSYNLALLKLNEAEDGLHELVKLCGVTVDDLLRQDTA